MQNFISLSQVVKLPHHFKVKENIFLLHSFSLPTQIDVFCVNLYYFQTLWARILGLVSNWKVFWRTLSQAQEKGITGCIYNDFSWFFLILQLFLMKFHHWWFWYPIIIHKDPKIRFGNDKNIDSDQLEFFKSISFQLLRV